ncbi:MAG: hypothetical protein JO006_09950 [Paucibacter sp.]|nr:hypothetical protein [Roseateles sp.]
MTQPERNAVAPGVWATLALALLVFAYLIQIELGRQRALPLSYDEMTFAACAARGLATQQVPITGCHDNKGPVIALTHQLVQWVAGAGYNMAAVKVAAFLVVGALVGLTGLLAGRLNCRLAGLATAALLLQALTADTSFLALKTETVGALFIVAGLIFLLTATGRAWARLKPLPLLASGSLMGLAVLTRQTYALVPMLCFVWIALFQRDGTAMVRIRWLNAVLFALATALPLLLFLAWFSMHGQAREYLAGLFVYPLVRGVSAEGGAMLHLAQSSLAVLGTLAMLPLLCGLAALAATSAKGPEALLLACAAAMLAVIVVSPSNYPFHVIPALPMMAVPAGGILVRIGERVGRFEASYGAWTIGSVLLVLSTLSAASSWDRNGRTDVMASILGDKLGPQTRGAYGYVLGMRSSFYAMNELVPASNLQFPWAFEGMPDSIYYHRPPPEKRAGRLLAWAQQSGVQHLLEDFERTPPRYILVVGSVAHMPGAATVTNLPGFDSYLEHHCKLLREHFGEPQRDGLLYDCRPSRD